MTRFLCLGLSVALIGCATISTQRETLSAKYVGKPIDVPIGVLGMPDREVVAAGRKAFVWEIGQGDCKLQMEVSPENIVKHLRLSGFPESCEGWADK